MTDQPTIFRRLSPATVQAKVDAYFKRIKKTGKSPTLTGLALELKCTRINLVDYAKTDAFGPILTQAKLRCENHLEERITEGAPPAGLSFILKNNYGWKEKTEVENTHKGLVSLGSLFDQAALQKKEQAVVEGEIIDNEPIDLFDDEELEDDLF